MKDTKGMKVILSLSYPFQIFYTVIILVSILVVDVRFSFYTRQECFCHKTVHSDCGVLAIHREQDVRVEFCVAYRTQSSRLLSSHISKV